MIFVPVFSCAVLKVELHRIIRLFRKQFFLVARTFAGATVNCRCLTDAVDVRAPAAVQLTRLDRVACDSVAEVTRQLTALVEKRLRLDARCVCVRPVWVNRQRLTGHI